MTKLNLHRFLVLVWSAIYAALLFTVQFESFWTWVVMGIGILAAVKEMINPTDYTEPKKERTLADMDDISIDDI